MNITIIGFGEAGPVFGKTLHDAHHNISAFDLLQDNSATRALQVQKTEALNIRAAPTIIDAVKNADLIISTVTASQATDAARSAVPGLSSTTHWLDLNSVSPQTKNSIREVVSAVGAGFTEAVAMDTVPAKGAKVPILLCGPDAQVWSSTLNAAGLNSRTISKEYGTASTTKLIRSIIIKGMESLFAEAIEAAAKVNVQQEVMESLQATYPELDWAAVAGYQLSRACMHANRRAGEMRESAAMLDAMDVSSVMATATAIKQQQLADRGLGINYTGSELSDFIHALQR